MKRLIFIIFLTGCSNAGTVELTNFKESFAKHLPAALQRPQEADLIAKCGTEPVPGLSGAATTADYETYLGCAAIAQIRSNIFSEDPDALMGILNFVDLTMESYEGYAGGQTPPCLDKVGTEFKSSFNYIDPATKQEENIDLKLTHYLSCIDEQYRWRAWGKDADDGYYIREGRNDNWNVHLAKAKDNSLEGYITSGDVDSPGAKPTYFMHIKSYPKDKATEITYTGAGIGFGCGVHMRIDQGYIGVKYSLLRAGNAETGCADDVSKASNAIDTGIYKDVEYCFRAVDFVIEGNLENCKSHGVNSKNFKLNSLSYLDIDYKAIPRILFQDPPAVDPFIVEKGSF